MFQRMHKVSSAVTIFVDHEPLEVEVGTSVAAALLAASAEPFRRSIISGAPRAPYCMIGHCFECLLQIDGVPNRQACMVTVHEGMQVARQCRVVGANHPDNLPAGTE